MPPKKNKPSRNGYWQFVLECRDKSTNQDKSIQAVQEAASKKWANMSKDEKRPYEVMAQAARGAFANTRYTTDGFDVEEIRRKEEEQRAKVADMKNDIKSQLQAARLRNALDDLTFFIIHINHLITPKESGDCFYICEIAVTGFSLRNGVNCHDVFHMIVKSGELPMGTYNPARLHSNETHQMLEHVLDDPPQNNTREVFKNLVAYLRKYGEDDAKIPILYTPDKYLAMVTKVINDYCEDMKFEKEIKVYQLEYMFFCLKNEAAGNRQAWPSETFSFREIERDVFSHTSGIACDFHELADCTVHCSRSVVIRLGYLICDICCKEMGIEVVPGLHVPENAKIPRSSTLSSRCSSVSSNLNEKGRLKPRRVDTYDSSTYDDNFPALGGGRSSTVSIPSACSFRTLMNDNESVSSESVCDSFGSLTVSEKRRRSLHHLKFPPHGSQDDKK